MVSVKDKNNDFYGILAIFADEMTFADFIRAHEGDDPVRLLLARDRYPGVDVALAASTLACRRRLRTKVPAWYAVPSLRFPNRLAAEQCSSAETARYKAAVAARVVSASAVAGARGGQNGALLPVTEAELSRGGQNGALLPAAEAELSRGGQNGALLPVTEAELSRGGQNGALLPATTAPRARLADLTGGLGVDSWAFAEVFGEVLYNEMQPALAAAAEENFKELGVKNIRVVNWRITPAIVTDVSASRSGTASPADGDSGAGPGGSVADVLGDFGPDILFLDPARRAGDGRKVFLPEDCQPDVTALLPELFAAARHVLLKLSPMADISLCVKRFGHVREVHAIAAEGECKELLLLLDREWNGGYTITAYENGSTLTWSPEEESAAAVQFASDEDLTPGHSSGTTLPSAASFPAPPSSPAGFLFEPGKALMKAGAFRLLCGCFGLKKLDTHTHLYVTEAVPAELAPLGKTFRILETLPLDKRTMKEAGRRYPRAEVTARNIPMTSNELRKRLGCGSGGDIHLFGVRTAAAGNVLLIGRGIVK